MSHITKLNNFLFINSKYLNNFKNNKYDSCGDFKKINYKFFFISLIPPFLSSNVFFFNQLMIDEKKILLKQSYILLTWFYYLSFLNAKKDKKNKLKFFVLPTKKIKFTLTKAPMAHKNWSKEQYQLKFYKIKIQFKSFFEDENELTRINYSLLFILLAKKNFPVFETNLLFLKYYNFFFFFKDSYYFNLYRFVTR